ncbi:MAG: DNA-binding protein [Chloroflexi bacterium]|nr:DNA-binding protein [Chloroflexota bacterium]OJV88726.1 MAG: DNA-binding protein [Chloroflexi bacterium 54-19]
MPGKATNDLPGGLSQPALRALTGAGITRLEDLTRFSETEIKQLHGIGPNALQKLKAALEEKGLSYAEKKSGK